MSDSRFISESRDESPPGKSLAGSRERDALRERVTSLEAEVRRLRRANTVLRGGDERFRKTFDNAAVGIAHVGVDGTWLRMNDRLCEITGYSKAEMRRMKFQDITHPDDLAEDNRQASLVLAGEIDTYSMKKRYLHKGGEIVWVKLTVSLVRKRSGAPDYFIPVIEDIGGLKATEDRLRELNETLEQRVEERSLELVEQERQLRFLAESVPHILWEMRPDGAVSFVNERGLGYFGKTREEMRGWTWTENLHPDDADETVRLWKRALEAREEFRREVRLKRAADGAYRWQHAHGVPMCGEDGGTICWYGTLTDIHERTEAYRDLRRLEREISETADAERRRIARDLHDSVGSLLSAANMRLSVLAEDIAEGRTPAEDDGKKIGQLIQEAIASTRTLTRGLYPVGDDPEDLVNALHDLVAGVRVHAAIQCRLHCPEPVRIEDPRVANHLFRIAQEAANNAVKHSGGSHVTIGLRKERASIVLSVKDNGRGIPPPAARRTGRKSLGMRILRYRAEEIGAVLEIKPRARKGTLVVCRLPVPAAVSRERGSPRGRN